MFNHYPHFRLRRLRTNPKLRSMLQAHRLTVEDLILPLFIRESGNKTAISALPGHFQLTLNDLAEEIAEIQKLKIPAILLFGLPTEKDAKGENSLNRETIIAQAIRQIKKMAPDLLVIADVCLCEYTDHGHCGVIQEIQGRQDVDNDQTLLILAQQALNFAKAGVDMVAPSAMMDGQVMAIRRILDENQFSHIPILSYSAKFASAFYGPFRLAVNSAPQFGDRQTYQMPIANDQEALREVALDIEEGADLIMVKPALAYLDIIQRVKQRFPEIPLAAYQVSGEFAMIKAAAEKGWLDEKRLILETTLAIKRAGADLIITYFAKDLARCLMNSIDRI